uniref:RecF/RecN/SMC N-terminal domain-containing protein n=1 Tax=Panagrolaimus sp. ES5 TaxID=591445 RepID=A0AC34GXS6_9BILA
MYKRTVAVRKAFLDFNDLQAKNTSTSWNKSCKGLSSNLLSFDRNCNEKDELKSAKNLNNSTLSLHIEAYENYTETDSPNVKKEDGLKEKDKKLGLKNKWKIVKKVYNCPTSAIQNPFEFPRQQENEAITSPEIAQFTASQRLLNPNEAEVEDLPSTSVSQRLQRRRSIEGGVDLSRTADSIDIDEVVIAGQVKEIELENFMCHANLKMRFDTDKFNCFYIVGPNGSGKSAIFAGLNIGLGGKGRANNRGNSLSSYIKEGEASAKIRVHLSNTGANRNTQYDKEIIIERIIRQTSSTYSLKSMDENGKIRVVSTAKKDLDNILKRFSIELENPLCWLSQDRAREFLQEMKPNKLYEIFMITSELCIVNKYHETTADHLQDMQKILENWREKQKEMKENFDKLKQIAEATQKIRAFERELSKYNWIALWIPMKTNVQKVEAIEKAVDKLQKDIEKCQKKIEGRDAEAVELRNSMQTMQQRFDEISSDITKNNVEIQQWKRVQSGDSMKSKQIANRVREIRSKLQSHDIEIGEANKTLESVLGRADRDILGEKAELQRKVNEAQTQLDEVKEQKNTINQRKLAVESERQDIFENLQDCDANIRNFKSEISKIERNQRERERVAHDQMARFGRDTTNILKYIEQYANKFSKKPIGPVGMHVKLHDKKWENGVEFLMKNNLAHYLCDNAKDRQVFDNMLKHHGIHQVPVATVKFADHKYNTASAEPDRQILTVAREAIIDEPTVYNYLVDVLHIETVMLIEKDNEGREIMSSNPPRNVTKAITESCAEIHPVKPDKPYRFYAGRGFRAHILGDITNVEDDNVVDDQKRYFEDQIRQVEKQREELKRDENKIREKAAALSKETQTISIDCNKLEKNISNCETEIRKLDSIASRETLINSAKETLAELNRMKEKDEEVLNQVLLEQEENLSIYNEKGQKIQEIVDRNKALAEELRNVENEVDKLRGEYENFDSATEKFRATIRNNERQIVKQNEQKDRLLTERETIEANLVNTSKYEKPDNMTDPPDFILLIDKETCDKKILKMKSEVASLTRLNEGQHVTEGELAAARQAYEKATEAEKDCAKKLKKVNKSFLAREELFAKVKEEIPIKLRKKFNELMSMRNYIGDLKVDHETQKIEISVQTHKDAKKGRMNEEDDEGISEDEDAAGRRLSVAAAAKKRAQNISQDLKGLSGGERSYTTACFVMALWSCVESPFRCLDEFDVFMDMVNRRIIMELLADLARQHRHIQFFFFTPQGISELHVNDVEVFTMAPARR